MVGTVLDPLDAEGGTKIKKGKDKDSKENCAQRITLCTWKEAPQVELCPVFLTFLSLFFFVILGFVQLRNHNYHHSLGVLDGVGSSHKPQTHKRKCSLSDRMRNEKKGS